MASMVAMNSQQKINYCAATFENMEQWLNSTAIQADTFVEIDNRTKMASVGRIRNNIMTISQDITDNAVLVAKGLNELLEHYSKDRIRGDALIYAAKRLIPVGDAVIAKKRDFIPLSAAELAARGLDENYGPSDVAQIEDVVDQMVAVRLSMINTLDEVTKMNQSEDSKEIYQAFGQGLEGFSNALCDKFQKLLDSLAEANMNLKSYNDVAADIAARTSARIESTSTTIDATGKVDI